MHPLKTGIALGSNLGDRPEQMRAARDFVFALHDGENTPLCSSLYQTQPVDCAPGTPPFLNAVAEIESPLEPAAMLARLRNFELRQGRAAERAKNSPRAIDLDLLYVGDMRINTPALSLPHPRMTVRRFVLQPLADIRPDLVLPGQTLTVGQLLEGLPAAPAVSRAIDPW